MQSVPASECFRFEISLNVSYVLGSAKQMVSAGGAAEQPLTLEYRGVVEQQLMEVIDCCCFPLSLLSGRERMGNNT